MSEVIVQISSGTGPEEVRRFVALLADQLASEIAAFGEVVASVAHGEEEAPRTVELTVRGEKDRLAALAGTYALVSRSGRRGKRARKRWFAGVTVLDADSAPALALRIEDVELSYARSGGPGGQHVNRTETAVRAHHPASGITVRVSSERSRHANQSRALQLLGRALQDRAEREQEANKAKRRLLHYRVVRGEAVRELRLDHRGKKLVPHHRQVRSDGREEEERT